MESFPSNSPDISGLTLSSKILVPSDVIEIVSLVFPAESFEKIENSNNYTVCII